MDNLTDTFLRFKTPLEHLKTRASRALLWMLPVAWIALFFVIPFIIVLKISFSESVFAAPPYTTLVEWVTTSSLNIKINLSNFMNLFLDDLYISSYFRSLTLAGISTFLCLALGYPMAYGLSQAAPRWQAPLLFMIILPFWTSFLIRVYAWIGLLSPKGIINEFLLKIGLISEPLPLLYNNFAVCLGIVYSYLPFMVLPLYAHMKNMDPSYLEAAADLGARPIRAFFKVTLPLSKAGIFVGSMLVFIPAVGEFVIPELLGGPENIMVGRVLWMEFFQNQDWPIASALAVSLLILLVLPIYVLQRLQVTNGDRHNA